MSAWTLVACLVALREEFNLVSPHRDKGADGSIGDSAHTSSSDHTPDEDSYVLRDHDADNKNEVHALDIDSSGPWPEPGWFNQTILDLVAREKREYESPTIFGRLQYVIWNRRIASRSWGWTWQSYSGSSDPHTNHAHFSARYTTAQEADTRPWGVYVPPPPPPKEIEVAFADEKIKVTKTTGVELFEPDLSEGAEVTASSLLQLAAIWARRAAIKNDTVISMLGELDRRLGVIEGWYSNLGGTTAPEQTAALLKAALGDNAPVVARIMLADTPS